jgi:hypothetical protein
MNVPYTTSTGIKIGVRYMENGKVASIDDPDMQYLQEALLATPNYITSKKRHQLTIALSTLALVFTVFGMVLFN